MTNDEVICLALKNELLSDLESYDLLPDYRISHKFDRKMKKIIAGQPLNNDQSRKSRITLKKYLLIAAVIIITAAILTGGTLFITKYWDSFWVKEYDVFALMTVENIQNSPQTLEDRYILNIDTNEYSQKIIADESFIYWVSYDNRQTGNSISFCQSTKWMNESVRLNTESAKTLPEKVQLGEFCALYFEIFNGDKVLIWDNGDYFFDLSAEGVSKNELIEMAGFVKKVEK